MNSLRIIFTFLAIINISLILYLPSEKLVFDKYSDFNNVVNNQNSTKCEQVSPKNLDQISFISSEKIPNPANIPAAHSVSAIYLNDQEILSVWFAGSREGASDVKIYSAKYSQNKWSAPIAIADINNTTIDSWGYIRKIGNPIIYYTPQKYYLFYVAVSAGGWAGSRIYFKTSMDGINWGSAQKIVNNAFLNISTLVRSPPIRINEQYLIIPAYHELAIKSPEYLLFDTRKQVVIDRYRPSARGFLQPTMVVKNEKKQIIIENYFRDNGATNQTGFQKWLVNINKENQEINFLAQSPHLLEIKNTNSGVTAISLPDNCSLFVFNSEERKKLNLTNLCNKYDINNNLVIDKTPINETTKFDEYSYPQIIANKKYVDVLYTWRREQIAHKRFSTADFVNFCFLNN